jgi:hypothetical protein
MVTVVVWLFCGSVLVWWVVADDCIVIILAMMMPIGVEMGTAFRCRHGVSVE